MGMNDDSEPMGDARGIRCKEARIETPHAARWGDRAGNQKQSGWVGQQAGFGKWLPSAFERRHAVALAPETEAGFFAGLADRRDRQGACARWRDAGTALQQVGLERLRYGPGDGTAAVGFVDPAAGKNEFAGHKHHLVVAFAD